MLPAELEGDICERKTNDKTLRLKIRRLEAFQRWWVSPQPQGTDLMLFASPNLPVFFVKYYFQECCQAKAICLLFF